MLKRIYKYVTKRGSIPKANFSFIKSLLVEKSPMTMRFDTKRYSKNSHNYDEIYDALNKSLFSFTSIISIELSNMCNYSAQHKKCVASIQKEKIVLPLKKICEIIDELKFYDKVLEFHVYSEPLIDPRLFLLIKYAKSKARQCKIHILTNGFYLTQTIAEELVDFGVDYLTTTAYSNEERIRLSKIDVKIPYVVGSAMLDERMNWYETEGGIRSGPCNAPYNNLIIRSNGDIGLCCMDGKNKYSFGNIFNESLSDVMRSDDMIIAFDELMHGKRKREICTHCIDSI
jgi:radical SAM protein with 4Fe4S-binding SPASM domain